MGCAPFRAAATAALTVLLIGSCSTTSPPPGDPPAPDPATADAAARSGDVPSASPTPDEVRRDPAPPAASAPTGNRVTPAPATDLPRRRSADGERRGDLVRGRRTLTGTVTRSGPWVLLNDGTLTWALTGAVAQRLRTGARVSLTGAVAPVPAGCPAGRALAVSRVG